MEILHKFKEKEWKMKCVQVVRPLTLVLLCVTMDNGEKQVFFFGANGHILINHSIRAQLIFDGLCEFNLYHSRIKHYQFMCREKVKRVQ